MVSSLVPPDSVHSLGDLIKFIQVHLLWPLLKHSYRARYARITMILLRGCDAPQGRILIFRKRIVYPGHVAKSWEFLGSLRSHEISRCSKISGIAPVLEFLPRKYLRILKTSQVREVHTIPGFSMVSDLLRIETVFHWVTHRTDKYSHGISFFAVINLISNRSSVELVSIGCNKIEFVSNGSREFNGQSVGLCSLPWILGYPYKISRVFGLSPRIPWLFSAVPLDAKSFLPNSTSPGLLISSLRFVGYLSCFASPLVDTHQRRDWCSDPRYRCHRMLPV